jgi:hypothetical protein
VKACLEKILYVTSSDQSEKSLTTI